MEGGRGHGQGQEAGDQRDGRSRGAAPEGVPQAPEAGMEPGEGRGESGGVGGKEQARCGRPGLPQGPGHGDEARHSLGRPGGIAQQPPLRHRLAEQGNGGQGGGRRKKRGLLPAEVQAGDGTGQVVRGIGIGIGIGSGIGSGVPWLVLPVNFQSGAPFGHGSELLQRDPPSLPDEQRHAWGFAGCSGRGLFYFLWGRRRKRVGVGAEGRKGRREREGEDTE